MDVLTQIARLISLADRHGGHRAWLGGSRFLLEAGGGRLAALHAGVGKGGGGRSGKGRGKHDREHDDSFREKDAFRDPESSLAAVLAVDEVHTRCSERAAQDELLEGLALHSRLPAQLVRWIRRERGGAG